MLLKCSLLILILAPGSELQVHLGKSLSPSVWSLEALVFLCVGVCVCGGDTLEGGLPDPSRAQVAPRKVLVNVMIIFPNLHTPVKPILQMRNVWL